jgi:uncharacterized sporulation protein YeaH/YhbH (DUF444 family)
MKRSEMETLISNVIDANGRFNEQVSSEELATIILEQIEQAGMKCRNKNHPSDDYRSPVYCWEDELS